MHICLFDAFPKVRPKHFNHSHKKESKKHGQKMSKYEKTAKQLLGELYSDREYLDKLLQDEGVFSCFFKALFDVSLHL